MLTIRQFCDYTQSSERLFQVLKAQGRGPRITRIGRRVLIPKEAMDEWLKERERAEHSPRGLPGPTMPGPALADLQFY